MQPELKVRKILGRTYLNENRLSEALDIFVKILMDYPDDLETLLILGGFYLASGDGKTAKNIYQHAQLLDPHNKTITHQILLAEEMETGFVEEPVPTDGEAVARLLQRLTGKPNKIHENDILRAASLLEKIISSNSPADLVSAHLDEIDDLLQALIEVNIRQARADGRADLAEGLHQLQLNIDFQLDHQVEVRAEPQVLNVSAPVSQVGNLLLLLPDLENISARMTLLKSTLESFGYQVIVKGEFIAGQDLKPDLVITSNPHTNPMLIDGLAKLSSAGVPILLDLDDNFLDQPVTHPEYDQLGLGTQTRSDSFTKAIALSNLITVPSWSQAFALREVSDRVFVIPDGWSRENKLWEKTPPPHSMISLGWVGSSGELEDLMLIRRYIIRILREFPRTRMVIIGNPQAYRLFDSLPENRRMYIPFVADEEFPYLLSQLDVLLVPLRNQPYNLTQPDTLLMQAGARGVPWLGSAIPSFREWMNGGVLMESTDDEWHLNLRHMVTDQELRKKLGKAGKAAAKSREMECVGKLWLDVIAPFTSLNSLTFRQAEKTRSLAANSSHL